MYSSEYPMLLPEHRLADRINDHPGLLLVMDHFGIHPMAGDKTIRAICREHNLSEAVFLAVANLAIGHPPAETSRMSRRDIPTILLFLSHCHRYYQQEKYPEVRQLITQLYELNDSPEIRLTGTFFDDYFNEVSEHLAYEDTIVFPYFREIPEKGSGGRKSFSAGDYQKHHTDIETKLADLKNLLLKHIPIKADGTVRRKLLQSLFELENDLRIHSMIEDTVLIPLISMIEQASHHD